MQGPIDTVNQLTDAINRGDLDRAVSLYEGAAVMVAQPGRVARGSDQLREAIAGYLALKPTLKMEAREVVEAGDVALYVSRWSLRGTDPAGKPMELSGESTDVLRRQKDGRWLIVVDNPWGVQILGGGK
jgi:uncharacterized protein (TIGR02246 family)